MKLAAYRKEKVDDIHNNKDKVANASVVVGVAGEDKDRGDDVVAKHLPVILATVFNVDDKDLLKPESPLHENITLHEETKLAVRPVGP